MIRFCLAFVAPILLLTACASSPTGRNQVILVSDGEMNKMGFKAFSEMKQKLPRETSRATVQYVNCVAQAVAKYSGDKTTNSHWEVVVFRDKSANAFALPGRKIGVHTGLLKVAKTPDQLAAVLGHEVAHVEARHGNERVSQGILAQTGLSIVDAATKDKKSHDAIMAGLGLGTQFGVLMPFGRTQESEADEIGLVLMAKAGFDPRQSVQLWKNMAKAGGSGPPEFLSTHPSHSTRIGDLKSNMPKALALYERSAKGSHGCQRP